MTWLITAGSAYFHSNAPTSRVSSSFVLSVVSNTVQYYISVQKPNREDTIFLVSSFKINLKLET